MTDYLQQAGLALSAAQLAAAQQALSVALAAMPATDYPDLYRYPVPKLGEGGSCSLVDELEAEPWDIAPQFGGESPRLAQRLLALQALLDAVLVQMPADWLGVYYRLPRLEADVLLKLAYRGLPSRAEFPLSEAFAAASNNSKVGRSGRGVVIDDVRQWQSEGGAYYECDPKVRSEVCLPVFDAAGEVIGILDAESAQPGFFHAGHQAMLAALACALSAHFVDLRALAKSAAPAL